MNASFFLPDDHINEVSVMLKLPTYKVFVF
jgi:hypothetical protein